MAKAISKSQIDLLGERLKKGKIEDDDLRLLDQYRRSFAEAYDSVVNAISRDLLLEPTGRPAKSTPSIVDKLHRESIRLTQIQDIAGCRIVVTDIPNQNAAVQSLKGLFESVTIVDRRKQPSHGYRAVHVIVRCCDKLIEIQVRTALQHLWAELSEKFADEAGQAVKYGGGNEKIRNTLARMSLAIVRQESVEVMLREQKSQLLSIKDTARSVTENAEEVANVNRQIANLNQKLAKYEDSINLLKLSLIEIIQVHIGLAEIGLAEKLKRARESNDIFD